VETELWIQKKPLRKPVWEMIPQDSLLIQKLQLMKTGREHCHPRALRRAVSLLNHARQK
jgi:hypothetical protein